MTTRHPITIASLVLVAAFFAAGMVRAQERTNPTVSLQSVLTAHRAWTVPPSTVEITGTSLTRSKEGKPVSEPVRIIATAGEEVAVEYGALRNAKTVKTPTRTFRDDGARITTAPAPPGFGQLDITSIFFLARAAQMDAAGKTPTESVLAGNQIIAADRGRTQTHYGSLKVNDTFEIAVGSDGLLSGISRTFYPKTSSLHSNENYGFSDYRDTGGVLLPYRITFSVKGRLVQTIEVSGYQFNTGADPALFAPRSIQ